MIRFNHVTKVYGENIIALHDVNFEISNGEFISIVGRSGAGKTTLLRLLIREEIPTQGEVLIENTDISTIRLKDLPFLRRKIGVVFQDIRLLVTRTAHENIAFAMEVGGVPRSQIDKDVPKLLETVGLTEKAQAFPGQLSGGEKQRVAIARALAHRPALILADEPTGNLDFVNAVEILNLLKQINAEGTTVVLATHARELVDRVKRRVVVLEKGEIISDIPQGKYKI